MKGVSYHTGSYRGKSVVVGSHLETADDGILCVTSKRAVFVGLRQTIEIPWPKLVSVNAYDDGIQFHVSGRKSAPLNRVHDGNVVAACVNAAAQRV